jgi:cadmium resistance protein CadD (predicted permease)
MHDSNLRQYSSLIIEIILIALGIMSTLSGEALGRYGRMVNRAEDPNKF